MNKESESVLMYAEGPNPSGRDIHNLTGLMEIAIVISYLNTAAIEKDRVREIRQNYRDFLSNKYNQQSSVHSKVNHQLLGITTRLLETRRFIDDQYNIKYDILNKFDRPISREDERYKTWFIQYAERVYENTQRYDKEIDELRRRIISVEENILQEEPRYIWRKSLVEEPEYHDFNEWIATEYGPYILPVQEVRTTKSIEILFNIASVGAILGFQSTPQIKDMVLYAESIFKDWMGRAKISKDKPWVVKIPHIPASVERTISKYDDVEISCNETGWTFKLKRNGNKNTQ